MTFAAWLLHDVLCMTPPTGFPVGSIKRVFGLGRTEWGFLRGALNPSLKPQPHTLAPNPGPDPGPLTCSAMPARSPATARGVVLACPTIRGTRDTEPVVVVRVAGRVVVAVGGTHVVRVVVPKTENMEPPRSTRFAFVGSRPIEG
jgi:hypothetical protein